ncbi:MAG: Shedu immune nuclease family protein, partial [Thermomicrobiales bacterium]
LSYCYLQTIATQANLGGTDLTGKGADKVDYLLSTSGDARFTVLVDIKRPDSALMSPKEYRTNIYSVAKAVSGGVAQLQSYCHTWENEGSRNLSNVSHLNGAMTHAPSGLLIVGNTAQFADLPPMARSFELFRRNTHNPEIITFDEPYTRTEFILSHQTRALEPFQDEDEDDDIPF